MTRVHRSAGMSVINLHAVQRLARLILDATFNVLVVYWFGQLAFPALGLVGPTLLGAVGMTGLAWALLRPLRLSDWMRG